MIRHTSYITALSLFAIAGPLLFALVGPQPASADEVRYFDKDGITYRETRRAVSRPVATTKIEERERVVYRQKITTETRDTIRTYQTPVTQYFWTTRVHGRWNPFGQPYTTYDLVPVTRWQQHTEIVPVPVGRYEWVPEKTIVRVPVTTYRMVEDEVISRVAVSVSGGSGATAIARRPSLGGVEMKNDPPREGSGWRAADSTVVR